MTKEEFVQSSEFVDAILSSTIASFSGSGYSVEFFDTGEHRLLWDGSIGNLYYHPNSEIIRVPTLSEEQIDEMDDNNSPEDIVTFYIEEMRERFLGIDSWLA